MPTKPKYVFETERLAVRIAGTEDVEFYFRLWTNPPVMKFVGFPFGLRITREEIAQRLAAQGESEFNQLLVAELKDTGQSIGECWLGLPDENGLVEPDTKLLPELWGHKYGVELFQAIVDYEFTHTDCRAVGGSPNVENLASIRMQEKAGAVRVGEGLYEFPEAMREYTRPVHSYMYQIPREKWESHKRTVN